MLLRSRSIGPAGLVVLMRHAICTKKTAQNRASHVGYALEHKHDLLAVWLQMVMCYAEKRKFFADAQSIIETNDKVQMLGHGNHPLPQTPYQKGIGTENHLFTSKKTPIRKGETEDETSKEGTDRYENHESNKSPTGRTWGNRGEIGFRKTFPMLIARERIVSCLSKVACVHCSIQCSIVVHHIFCDDVQAIPRQTIT